RMGGHFESPDLPGYTQEGDTAARTSGLSFNNKSPKAALEGLLAVPYHRNQYIDTYASRIGVGFASGYTHSRYYSMALFVTYSPKDHLRWSDQQVPPKDHRPGGCNMIDFPPHNAVDIPLTFPGEHPDPRPLSR